MDQKIPENWLELTERLSGMFGVKIDLNGVLFLVGMRERGMMFREFTKEEKTSLINLGSCMLYREMGLTEIKGYDSEGWPVFRQLSVNPHISEERKQKTLQDCAILYFRRVFAP